MKIYPYVARAVLGIVFFALTSADQLPKLKLFYLLLLPKGYLKIEYLCLLNKRWFLDFL
jgi:hypothetical protein